MYSLYSRSCIANVAVSAVVRFFAAVRLARKTRHGRDDARP